MKQQPTYRSVLAWILLLISWVWGVGNARAQYVDELTPATDTFPSVGAAGVYDFLAQSFVAEVGRVSKVGAWIMADSASGEVQLTIYGNSVQGTPDLNYIVYQSALIAPSDTGAWVYDTITNAALSPGDTF